MFKAMLGITMAVVGSSLVSTWGLVGPNGWVGVILFVAGAYAFSRR